MSKLVKEHKNIKAVLMFNPGDPTGKVLKKEQIQEMIRFCVENRLVLISNECLSESIHNGEAHKHHHTVKIMNEMPEPYNQLELFSIYSLSRGFYGM